MSNLALIVICIILAGGILPLISPLGLSPWRQGGQRASQSAGVVTVLSIIVHEALLVIAGLFSIPFFIGLLWGYFTD